MENKTDFPPFYVGQKVVVIETTKHLVKGDEYIIKAVSPKRVCGCWSVDVGVKRLPVTDRCHCDHGNKINGSDWFNYKYFAPIESTFQSITFEQVVEIESPLIGVN